MATPPTIKPTPITGRIINSHSFVGNSGKSTQFMREKAFSSQRGQRKTSIINKVRKLTGPKKASGRNIIGEVIREEGMAKVYYKHVTAPQPPIHLYGKKPTELVKWYEELRAMSTTKKEKFWLKVQKRWGEKKQRTSTVTLIGAIASYPGKPESDDPAYLKWRKLTVAWFRLHYGKTNIASILEHRDENNFHIHCLVYDASNFGGPVNPMMTGHAAAEKAKANGVVGKEVTKIHNAAYSRLQDNYYLRVSKKCGLARISEDPKPRLQYAAGKRNRRELDELALATIELAEEKSRSAMVIRRANEQNAMVKAELKAEKARTAGIIRQADTEIKRRMDRNDVKVLKSEEKAFSQIMLKLIQAGTIDKYTANSLLKEARISIAGLQSLLQKV
jgi:hypothetical protein